MKGKRRAGFILIVTSCCCSGTRAQNRTALRMPLSVSTPQAASPVLPRPKGFADHMKDGKLVLLLDDAIHLALANNPDISIDRAAVSYAKNDVGRQYKPFDPIFSSGFDNQR